MVVFIKMHYGSIIVFNILFYDYKKNDETYDDLLDSLTSLALF
jgi:hypothetical protein